jgi:Gpi18-like mannosyltransferase
MIRYFRDDRSLRHALAWLAVFAAAGAALVLLYHDADQQDSGYHFLFARWAHRHPQYFISVWARPLFTLLYFPFAQFGYAAAKFLTVIISLGTAWQTFRLARQIKFDRAEMAIPLLFLQPSFFLLSSTVLTETLFALVFVIALRLHLSGRIKAGMIVASLLILVRPEGFFIGVLWGVWVLRIADCELRIAD